MDFVLEEAEEPFRLVKTKGPGSSDFKVIELKELKRHGHAGSADDLDEDKVAVDKFECAP